MRLAFNIALIASVLFLPWWAGALIALSACFLVDGFWEVIAYGIVADALYGTNSGWHGFSFMATAYALIVFLFASAIRKRLAW